MPPPPTATMKSMSATKPRQTMRGHTDWVTGVAHLTDGRRIITCSSDGALRLWEIESGTQIGDDWRDAGEGEVWCIALSPNGQTVASGSRDGRVRLWDVETKKVVAKWTGHNGTVRSLCWSVDGERVVSVSQDGPVRVWDVESGDTVLGPIKTGHVYVCAVIYSPDTTKIATGGATASKIWDAKTGNLLSTIKHDSAVWSLAWTSDQMKLITGSYASIRIFDAATWQQIAILEGHTHVVDSLSLFQNDRLLASGSDDETARLWNLDTNLPVGPPLQHQAFVQTAAISADGKLLVTGGDRNAYVWDIHTILKDAGLEELLSIRDDTTPTQSQESSAYSLQDLTDRIQERSNYPIASGGFGDIWKCILVSPNEVVPVAVKAIRTFELDDDASMRKNSRRVRRELKVWGRLKHDCILPLWGVATGFGPYPAMICPWVLNGALTGFLVRQQNILSPQDKFSLLNDIALGLQYLHSKSIIHGDLTGSNVLVQGNGRACLADFGLSTMVLGFTNPSYFTSSIKGNIRWAAAELFEIPEDYKDNTVVSLSIECDIYSFGSIALQVLTCKVPYYYVLRDNVVLGHVIRGRKPEPPEESQIAPLHWEFIQRCWSSRACRPTAGEIVAFIACERDALVS